MSSEPSGPPGILFGGRVLEYAVLDDRAAYSGHSYLFVDGKELGPVPRLAICQSAEGEILLIHCDDEWAVLGVAQFASIAEAKKRAERTYPGVTACWVSAPSKGENHGSDELETWAAERCSFCGKRPDQVRRMIEAGNTQVEGTARICDSCIIECYEMLEKGALKA